MAIRILNAARALGIAVAMLLALCARSSAADICGKPQGTPDEVFERLTKVDKLREARRSELYVALEDAGDGTIWTFTLPPHPAHPAVVCRRIMERRGLLEVPTIIVCKGAQAECAKLKTEFEAVNERMLQELYKQKK
jgi:hypothetical protein